MVKISKVSIKNWPYKSQTRGSEKNTYYCHNLLIKIQGGSERFIYLFCDIKMWNKTWCVDTQVGVSPHHACIVLRWDGTQNVYFYSNFNRFLTNFRQFLADFAYFCRFSASSETFRQLLVVFTSKICIIKTFGVLTHDLKIK